MLKHAANTYNWLYHRLPFRVICFNFHFRTMMGTLLYGWRFSSGSSWPNDTWQKTVLFNHFSTVRIECACETVALFFWFFIQHFFLFLWAFWDFFFSFYDFSVLNFLYHNVFVVISFFFFLVFGRYLFSMKIKRL